MTQVNKIETNNIIYHIAASPNATNNFVSDDLLQESASFWTNVELLSQGDMNNVILNKISTMFKNIRYLKNIVGNNNGFNKTNTISKQLNGKLGKNDKISINQMSNIVSNMNENSTNKIPLLSILCDMDTLCRSLEYNTIDIINYFSPNNRYDVNKSFTFNNVNDVNAFCNKYNRNNLYKVSDTDKLSLGNKIQINDGTYNKQWIIAGFDLEKDLKVGGFNYDNGYGILLIPDTTLGDDSWNSISVENTSEEGYVGSYMNQTVLPNMANNLRNNVLGNHLINRKVSLTTKKLNASNPNPNDMTTSSAYLTLMSICQLTGDNSDFDNGEANYKLPLFNHIGISVTDITYWTRNIANDTSIFAIYKNNELGVLEASYSRGVRPIMMIR